MLHLYSTEGRKVHATQCLWISMESAKMLGTTCTSTQNTPTMLLAPAAEVRMAMAVRYSEKVDGDSAASLTRARASGESEKRSSTSDGLSRKVHGRALATLWAKATSMTESAGSGGGTGAAPPSQVYSTSRLRPLPLPLPLCLAVSVLAWASRRVKLKAWPWSALLETNRCTGV